MSSSGVTIETKIPLPDKTADSLTSVMTITDKEERGKKITTVDHMIYLDKEVGNKPKRSGNQAALQQIFDKVLHGKKLNRTETSTLLKAIAAVVEK
ncbi:hypothetical protein BAG01nite_47730 [Brevibacillus agri]|uniref:Uncharacterized protein n=2 Tax=Brevibacillus TaxID=55080 RepID=A0A938Y250_9BACL|nr:MULTISPECIES: hypothetical protein [Brevibacillus]MBM7591778.1 hypothetical protein [Brevibacillus fulvus]QAV11854.1 hypothetical protein BA6348_03240 [Brevibacillus agri]RNB51707.1 hypothetical protein EB820_19575 [Brevibacillus agri]GED28671.1 hypothetical protein BAG01nite_47730 [Brevibacillus agri]